MRTGGTGAGRLEVDGLTVSYGRTPVVRGVSVAAGPGELLGVVGPNGAGKSTLLKAIVGLVPYDAGSARVDGRPVADVLHQVAYLPQRASVDWDFPVVVRDVVAMGRAPHLGRLGRPRPHDHRLVAEAIERLGLATLAEAPMGELSGGQRQRAFLARALAQQATVLLLDEPFAGVDAVTERLLWSELVHLAHDGHTVVLVNHDLVGVLERCDRLMLLAGRVVACGAPEEVGTPANLFRTYGGIPATRTAGSAVDPQDGQP